MVERLRQETVAVLQRNLVELVREEQDRSELPIDFRLLGPLLQAAGDPDVTLSSLAKGRMPRCAKLYTKKKRRWRIPEQPAQVEVDDERRRVCGTSPTRRYHLWRERSKRCSATQAQKGQVLIMPVADSPNWLLPVCDGTNGNFINTSTHVRDQDCSSGGRLEKTAA